MAQNRSSADRQKGRIECALQLEEENCPECVQPADISSEKLMLVCRNQQAEQEMTIWDSNVSEFSTGLELKHVFECVEAKESRFRESLTIQI